MSFMQSPMTEFYNSPNPLNAPYDDLVFASTAFSTAGVAASADFPVSMSYSGQQARFMQQQYMQQQYPSSAPPEMAAASGTSTSSAGSVMSTRSGRRWYARDEVTQEEKMRNAKERKYVEILVKNFANCVLRRMHNRVSAKLARQRKKTFIMSLQAELLELKNSVEKLKSLENDLASENASLRHVVASPMFKIES